MTGNQPTPERERLIAQVDGVGKLLAASQHAHDQADAAAHDETLHVEYRDAYRALAAGYRAQVDKRRARLAALTEQLSKLDA